MTDKLNNVDPLETLSNYVTEAHTRIQNDFGHINPVVGVSRKLRSMGIMADMITIDCLKSQKRIIVILQDEMPGIVRYQFSFIKEDPSDEFEVIQLTEMTQNNFYTWMKDYFSAH